MQPPSAPPFEDTSSPSMDHQYSIGGYCATGTKQPKVPTTSDHSAQAAPTTSQRSHQAASPSNPTEPPSSPVRYLSKQYGSSKVISECNRVKAEDDVVPHEHMQPTPTFTASHAGVRQILPSQYRFDLNCHFEPETLASQDNMNATAQAQSPFSPEVEAFTKSYLSPPSCYLPILPPFTSSTPRASSLTTQAQGSKQLPSTQVNTTKPSQSIGDIVVGDANQIRSHLRDSSNVAPDLGQWIPPSHGLVITGAPQISAPSLHSHHRIFSDRTASSTSKQRSKGEFSDDTNHFCRSPEIPSPFNTSQSTDSEFALQQRKQLDFDLSKLKTGFTPFLEQQEADRANNKHQPRKKLRLSDKETSIQTTPISSPTASFGPLLQPARGQDQSTFVQSSCNDVQADSNTFSLRPSLSNANQNTISLSPNLGHAEGMRSEIATLVSPEVMERVEARTVALQAMLSYASLRAVWAQPKGTSLSTLPLASDFRKPITQELLSALQTRQLAARRLTRLKTFHPFSRLPIELQQRIWTFSLPGPRTIHLTSPPSGLEFFLPKNKPPIALSINSQSRAVALRTLRPAFENAWLVGAYTHFDFSRDSLRLGDGSGVFTAKTIAYSADPNIVRDRERVRHLEIPFRISHTTHSYNCLAALICKAPERGWPGIRTLAFTGDAKNGGAPKKMPIVEVERGNVVVDALVEIIRGEFRMVYEEFWFMPDCGLKIVYLGGGE